jgi:hypothetical protein
MMKGALVGFLDSTPLHVSRPKLSYPKGFPMFKIEMRKRLLAGLAAAGVLSSNAFAVADITVAAPTYDNLWYAVGIMAGVLITFAVGKKVLGYFRG